MPSPVALMKASPSVQNRKKSAVLSVPASTARRSCNISCANCMLATCIISGNSRTASTSIPTRPCPIATATRSLLWLMLKPSCFAIAPWRRGSSRGFPRSSRTRAMSCAGQSRRWPRSIRAAARAAATLHWSLTLRRQRICNLSASGSRASSEGNEPSAGTPNHRIGRSDRFDLGLSTRFRRMSGSPTPPSSAQAAACESIISSDRCNVRNGRSENGCDNNITPDRKPQARHLGVRCLEHVPIWWNHHHPKPMPESRTTERLS